MGPLLGRYKSLLKTVSRDASLRARHAGDVSGALREIERWLAEARVAAHTHTSEFASWLPYREHRRAGEEDESAVAAQGEDDDDDDDDDMPEPTEAWALDKLCDALLVKGALVPLSRKSVNLSRFLIYTLSPPSPPFHVTRASQNKFFRPRLLTALFIFFFICRYLDVLESGSRHQEARSTIRRPRCWRSGSPCSRASPRTTSISLRC